MSEAILARMGKWVAELDSAAIPEETRRAARYQVINMIAAAHAAGTSPACRGVEQATAALAGAGGRATVFASGHKLPPVEAALVNAAYAMAHDFDDIVWMGHTCHSAVFAPLAVAEHEGATTRAMLDAVVIANEIAGRLGASSFFGPLNGQMWSFIHLVGAAAGAARLLKLDAEQTTHALAISLAQPNFVLQPGFFQPSSKVLTASTPTATGIRAAYLARAGVTGNPKIVEDPKGFWRRFSFLPLPGMMDGLGEFWVMQTLAFKTFPGCFYFQTTLAGIAEVQRRRPGLDLDDVASVKIATTKLGTEVTRFAEEYAGDGTTVDPVNVDFDLALAAATMLHAGTFTSKEHDEAWLAAHSPAIRSWRAKIELTHDPVLTARVINSARGAASGRAVLSGLGARDLIRLVQKYRQEYRSSLLTLDEARGWLGVALGRGPKWHEPELSRPSPSAIPLYFPGRVTVLFKDGAREEVEVDLPPGAFCAPHVERELETKFVRESTPSLGAARAAQAFRALLQLESSTLPELCALASAR